MTRSYSGSRTEVRPEGLWPLRAERGEGFRWIGLARRSALSRRRVRDDNGVERVVLTEDSTGRQEDSIFSYVEKHKLGVIVDVFPEIQSAYKQGAKRQVLDDALEVIRSGRANGIIVWKLDRLTRRKNQMRRILTFLEDHGACLYSIQEGIDTADPNKKEITELVLNVYIGAAESESRSIGERVSLMQADRARKGLVWRGKSRGFGHAENRKALVESEVELLHEAGERLVAGEPAHSIAEDWRKRGITTAEGNPWRGEVLRRALLSPRMIGKRDYMGERYRQTGVEPIFEEDEWERVCAAIKKRTHHSGPQEVHLLSNIALCGVCQVALTSSKPQQWKFAYVCKRREGNRNACGKLSVIADYADECVDEAIIGFLSDHERVNALFHQYAAGPESDAIEARITELNANKRRLGQALNPPPGIEPMDLDLYYEQVAIVGAELTRLRQRQAVTREARFLQDVLEFENPAHEWATRSLLWKRKLLELVTKRIIIEPRGKGSNRHDLGYTQFDPSRVHVEFVV
jgi:DNA invertase Pin-like site-specific DNA recombinase